MSSTNMCTASEDELDYIRIFIELVKSERNISRMMDTVLISASFSLLLQSLRKVRKLGLKPNTNRRRSSFIRDLPDCVNTYNTIMRTVRVQRQAMNNQSPSAQ